MRYLITLLILLATAGLSAQDLLEGAEYHENKGDSLYQAGNYQEAKSHLTKAIFSSKNDPDLYVLAARNAIKLQEINNAKRYLRRASRIGNYEADLLLDSLMGRSRNDEYNEQFEKDLDTYFRQTEPLPNSEQKKE